jgi:hypothetical protein
MKENSTLGDIESRFTEIIDVLSNVAYGLGHQSATAKERQASYSLECLIETVKSTEFAVKMAIDPRFYDPHP